MNSSGTLPAGYHAELATSAVNPGWDIAIVDNYGNILDTLQLKATEQVSYVKEALGRYPDIDVVTTSEVYNQLSLEDLADNVINSGISNTEITDVVINTFHKDAFDFDWCPSIVPFLIIAYSVSKKECLSKYQKGKEFGGRAFSSWIGYLAGGAVTGLTGGFWVAGIAAALLTNSGLEYGRQKYRYYNSLKACTTENEKILNRLRFKLSVI